MSPWAGMFALHFLRPWWLCALVLLPVLIWWWHRRRRERSVWQHVVDAHLLPRLLEVREDRRSRVGLVLASLAYLMAALALAGPSWRQSEQPLWQSRMPLIVALDLSSAALAGDLPPTRLAHARAKLASLLRQRQGGQIGLVVFAGDAFTVAPLTDDAGNVAVFLDALQPDVMPRDGQRADAAIAWSVQLLQRAGATRGDIVVLTDHADSHARDAAAEAAAHGYRVSALGMGTEAGAAFRNGEGAIVQARLDDASLRRLATSGGGRYATMADDETDLRALGVLSPDNADAGGAGGAGRVWRDEGYWLLPPLMLLGLFAFRRRNAGAFVLLLACALPLREANAADLWRRSDQAEYAQVQRGNQAYRSGNFKAAAQEYAGVDSATAHYNRGNALAKSGDYPKAIEAYDQALRRQPGMPDALANKGAVEAAMKRQQQGGGKGAGQKSQSGQSNPQSSPSQGSKASNSQKPSSSAPQKQANPSQRPNDRAQAQPSPAKPQDANAQQEADRAQRERMQRALQQAKQAQDKSPQRGRERREETPEQRERRLANEAWLRRVPDDPGGLLRAKFRLEYERRVSRGRAEE
ncbi:VWA domain-containing protein [Lysobacter tyrosinilyticus]